MIVLKHLLINDTSVDVVSFYEERVGLVFKKCLKNKK